TTLNNEDQTVLDKRRVERVVLNLLENARDHAGGATAISVTGDQKMLRIVVEDAGAGVAVSERERIFERFARGTASRNSTGSGLGLAIVQEHARALGGKGTETEVEHDSPAQAPKISKTSQVSQDGRGEVV
ncbi:MAG: sensor histidine kinase, partial [Actinomycetota bacterium]